MKGERVDLHNLIIVFHSYPAFFWLLNFKSSIILLPLLEFNAGFPGQLPRPDHSLLHSAWSASGTARIATGTRMLNETQTNGCVVSKEALKIARPFNVLETVLRRSGS